MTILHSLVGLHERLVADGTAPAFGFSRENISYGVVLSPDGEVVDVQDIRDASGRMSRPSRRVVPRPVKRTGQPLPNFLWDKTAFALGVKRDTGTQGTGLRRGRARRIQGLSPTDARDLRRRWCAGISAFSGRMASGGLREPPVCGRHAGRQHRVPAGRRGAGVPARAPLRPGHLVESSGRGRRREGPVPCNRRARGHRAAASLREGRRRCAIFWSFPGVVRQGRLQVLRQGTRRQRPGVRTSRVRLHGVSQYVAGTRQKTAHPDRRRDHRVLGGGRWRRHSCRRSRGSALFARRSTDRCGRDCRGGRQAHRGCRRQTAG